MNRLKGRLPLPNFKNMAITFNLEREVTVGTADQDYFLDIEGNVTTDTEKAHQLLIRAGQEIPKQMADDYGIGKVAQKDEKAEKETVKSAKPSANKAEKAAENKGVK
jgi:hypothetical protein